VTRETCGRDHVDVLRREVATLKKYISPSPKIMEYHEEHIARMAGAADELEALRAENAGLRKALVVKNAALKPFVRIGTCESIMQQDEENAIQLTLPKLRGVRSCNYAYRLLVGDFRRAAEAMKEVRDD